MAHALGTPAHLVNGRFAIERKDVSKQKFAKRGFRFSRLDRDILDEKFEHDVGPAMPQPGERPVKVEHDVTNLRASSKARTELD